MSSTDPNLASASDLASALVEAAGRAARAQSYRLPDGTMVQRPDLSDVLDARERLNTEVAARRRGGLYLRVGFQRG